MKQIPAPETLAHAGSLEENTPVNGGPPGEEDVYALPASFAQQRLWFLEQWEQGVYNIALAFTVHGNLNIAVLEQALQEIIRRHEALRTTFTMVNAQLLQVIAPHLPFSVGQIDLSAFSEDVRIMKTRRLIKEDFLHPFNLQLGPLLRVTVLKANERKHTLLIAMHHSISDGWSLEVLFSEMSTLYTAYVSGQPSPLPELPIQYADYSLWQQNYLQGELLAEQLSYWREQLADLPVLQLPVDRARPAIQTFRGAVQALSISAELTSALHTLSRKAGVTLFMTLLAAFQTLLFRYTDQLSIPVGVPIAGRNESNLETLIGCFINTLVMRADFVGNPTFLELLERVRELTLGAYEHQDIPFEKLAEMLQPERDLSHNPLTQVMFALQNVPQSETHLPDLTLIPLNTIENALISAMGGRAQGTEKKYRAMAENKTAMFDLELTLWEREDHLYGEIKYSTDLFDPETIDRLQEHFLTLLESIITHPNTRVADLSLLTGAERKRLLEVWNTREDSSLPEAHFLAAFARQVESTPQAVAVGDEDERVSYWELNARAERMAAHLQEHGIAPEQLVGVYTGRSVPWAIAVLALLKTGGVYLPLDLRHPAGRLRYMLAESGCRLILTTRDLAPELLTRLEAAEVEVLCLEDLLESQASRAWQEPMHNVNHLAYVIYTSGSTGKPKGAMIEQGGMLNHLYAKVAALDLDQRDIVAQTASQCFDISVWQLLAAWLVGGQTRIYADEVVADPRRLLAEVKQDRVSILEIVPSWLSTLLDTQEDAGEQTQIEHLRWLIPTGEALAGDLCARWLRRYPQIPLLNAYGPTECSDDVTHQVISELAEVEDLVGTAPIGKALANLRVYVLDRRMRLLPTGVHGEIYVGGAGVGRGYLGDPARTAVTFVPDPWSIQGGERLYRTGDLGYYRADGNVAFLGRVDQQVKLRGYRIELGEIEQVLRKQQGVKECVVVMHEHASGREQLVGYVVHQADVPLVPEEILRAAREELPEYMVPTALVQLEALPLTPNGKIDRQALPAPGAEQTEAEGSYIAPRNQLEAQLEEIWIDLLGLRRVGIYDDFFAIGGHSLLAVRLMTQIEKHFGKRLPLAALFQSRTIEALAEVLRRHATLAPWSLVVETQLPTVDLQAEATLDMDICPEVWSGQPITEPACILLTGASGFVGTFLLAELLERTTADIYCLLRAPSQAEGERKIQKMLEDAYLWQPAFRTRIKALPGDLAQPLLGLGEETFTQLAALVDVIYHNGAWVNMVYPYEELKATNVQGTREIIRLATRSRVKTLHHISTLGVFPHKGEARVQRVSEQESLDEYHEYVRGGYAQSKWVAEKLVSIARARGLPVVIYRPGRITGHSQTGAWPLNDILSLMIRGCIELGLSPIFSAADTLEIIPVDYVCRGIVALSRRKTSFGQAFHFYNPAITKANDVIGWIIHSGYQLQQVEYSVWWEELSRAAATGRTNVLAPFLGLLPRPDPAYQSTAQPPLVIPDTRNTQAALARAGISCPPVDARLLQTYLSYMVQSNALKAPESRR